MDFTFFIPTYNRVDSLRKSISSIFEHWNDDCKKIIISDNNISSIAKNVVDEFEQGYINYYQNNENIGIDKNMLRFLDLSKTRYCWLLGDDDYLNDKSHNSISPLLKENVDFIILLNGSEVKGYESGIHDISDVDKVGRAFTSFWDKLPFGNVIVNVEAAKKLDFDKCFRKYQGTSHAYSGVLWELALSEFSTGKFGVVTTKNLETYNAPKTWVASAGRIYLKEIPLWFSLLPVSIKSYKDEAYNMYLKSIFKPYSLLNFIRFRELNEENRKIIESSMSNQPFRYRMKWILALFFYPFYLQYKKQKDK